MCCSCTRYSENIKEIYIVPKNPIGFSRGSFSYFKEYDPTSQVGRPWKKEELVDKSLAELVDILRENEEIDEWSSVEEGQGFYLTERD